MERLTQNKLTDVLYVGHTSPGDSEPTPEQSLEKFKSFLKKYTLHPMFTPQEYGNFIISHPDRHNGLPCVTFFGNFWNISCAFRIDTNDADLIREVKQLIYENRTSAAFAKASADYDSSEERQKNFYMRGCNYE